MLASGSVREDESGRDSTAVGDSSQDAGENLDSSGDSGVDDSSEPSDNQVTLVSAEDFEILSSKVDALVTENVVLIVALFMVCGIMAVQTVVKSFEVF